MTHTVISCPISGTAMYGRIPRIVRPPAGGRGRRETQRGCPWVDVKNWSRVPGLVVPYGKRVW
eukprot:166408-Hanusia_phi.AAC.1